MKASPTDCSPRGSPHRLGARGVARVAGLAQADPALSQPRETAVPTLGPMAPSSQQPSVKHLLAELGALTCYFPIGQGVDGGGSRLLLPKLWEVPEWPRRSVGLQPEGQRPRETHRLCPETEGQNATSPALPGTGGEA